MDNPNILSELKVTDLSRMKDNPENKKYFLAYKDTVFILDDESKIHGINSRIKRHLKKHPGISDKHYTSGVLGEDDVTEFLNRMAEISPDVVVGNYYPDQKSIVVWRGQEVQPRTSLAVKKIANQLGLTNVVSRHVDEPNFDDDLEITYPTSKLLGDVPDVVFHGTNAPALKSILKYGLMAGKNDSRFSSIIHKKHVFFTGVFQEAKYYAFNAVHAEKKQKWGNFPIIIEFNVPDKRLLSPDYDADTYSTSAKNRQFKTVGSIEPTTDMKPMTISREIGKWSYEGRIPASQIRWVYYYKPMEKKWHKSRPETWQKLMWNYDWEQLGWKLGLQGPDDL
jgi:hypothetical protein